MNNILTAIVQGMRKEEPQGGQYAATCALLNAVDFASVKFENDGEQKYIMQMTLREPRARTSGRGGVLRVHGPSPPRTTTSSALYERPVPGELQGYPGRRPVCRAPGGGDRHHRGTRCACWTTKHGPRAATTSSRSPLPTCSRTACHAHQAGGGSPGRRDLHIAMAGATCIGLIANTTRRGCAAGVALRQENIGKADRG